MSKYSDSPTDTDKMPPGVPFIIGNELAERFSFYGMKAILVVFMTKYLLDANGDPDFMGEEQAKGVYHLFTAAAYFFPILGAILSDVLWGKYKTILLISLMYCLGHGMLALMDVGPHFKLWGMEPFMYAGLLLIAIGAGGIKPCVSAHVGDQFGSRNKHLLTQVFNWFYFSINVGAATSTLLTPFFLDAYGPWLAFGVPGVLMAVATFLFWCGRNRFVHVPPAGWRSFKEETFSPEGKRALRNLAPLFLIFIPVFWSIFDQTGSAWVLQAKTMNREFGGVLWLESQIQAANPILILTLIPVFTYLVYPLVGKVIRVTPLRKIGFGLFLTAFAFGSSAVIEMGIESKTQSAAQSLWTALAEVDTAGLDPVDDAATLEMIAAPQDLENGLRLAQVYEWEPDEIQPHLANMPNIGWQFLAYILLTAAEVLVSIVSLEFAYTQAPRKMKSFVMGVYFLGVSLGNLFTSGVNFVLDALKAPDGSTPLDGANYYWAFTLLALVTAIVFVFYARTYKGETYIQGEGSDAPPASAEEEARATDA